MIVRSCVFITSATHVSQCPPSGLPEVAFVGRSNVGKSSLINKLLNRRQLARTSRLPGKTQMLNYFLINEQFYLVDLPGYGYARVSKTKRAGWGPLIDSYLGQRTSLRLVVQLVDLRHPPSAEDKLMAAMLAALGRTRTIAGTKADKLKRGELARQERAICAALPGSTTVPFVRTSADSGMGMEALWKEIERALELTAEMSRSE